MAPFVKEQNVGLVVDSLSQISERLAALTPAEYARMREAACMVSERLSQGYYFREGLKSAYEYLALKS